MQFLSPLLLLQCVYFLGVHSSSPFGHHDLSPHLHLRGLERKTLHNSEVHLASPHRHAGSTPEADPSLGGQWIAQPGSKWDAEFKKGKWRYLDTIPLERVRLAAIGSGLTRMYGLPVNATILDVGCGEGIISDYITAEQKANYIGVDISKVAIDQAIKKRGAPMTWAVSVAHEYTPPREVDVVIFSEMLYYVDFEKVLTQYESYLSPNGIIVISLWCPDKEEGMFSEIRDFTRSHFNVLDSFELIGNTGNPDPRVVHTRIDVVQKKKQT
jgi:SAM-dependent methyltransferase